MGILETVRIFISKFTHKELAVIAILVTIFSILIGVGSTTLYFGPKIDSLKMDVNNFQSENSILKNANISYKEEINKTQNDNSILKNQNIEYQKQINTLNSEIQTINNNSGNVNSPMNYTVIGQKLDVACGGTTNCTGYSVDINNN